jgi:multiple sugar transport system permease protein
VTTPGTRTSWPLRAALAVASLAMAAPLLWTLLLSVKPNDELLRGTQSAFAPPYTLQNYTDILRHSAVFGWLLNSAIVSLSVTFGVLALSSLAGYGFARLRFPGRDAIFILVLFGLAIPEQSVIIARHQMFSALHLHNTYPGLILPGLAAPFGVFLMTQYFRAIPKELEEAAWLDGASRFKTFWRILLPLSLPAQATLGIFTFLSTWNDYWWPLISATNSERYTLTVGVASSQMNFAQTNGLGFLMAQAVFASVPILFVYVIFQKYIVAGVARAAAR